MQTDKAGRPEKQYSASMDTVFAVVEEYTTKVQLLSDKVEYYRTRTLIWTFSSLVLTGVLVIVVMLGFNGGVYLRKDLEWLPEILLPGVFASFVLLGLLTSMWSVIRVKEARDSLKDFLYPYLDLIAECHLILDQGTTDDEYRLIMRLRLAESAIAIRRAERLVRTEVGVSGKRAFVGRPL